MTAPGIKALFLAALAVGLLAAPAFAQQGDADKGEETYVRRCMGCHGEEGEGDGPAAERLIPPPRDFTFGLYKFKTTAFDDDIANDSDLARMIRDGMPGTAMPNWGDVLSEQDIRDVIAYIKTFSGLEEEVPSSQVDYGSQIASSEDSIKAGRELFKDRCSECHGESAKGVATKKLKNDEGVRTWPRNLTKPWTFRASSDPKDIFTRTSVGIPGTQMPSFADPKSKKKLSIEERWHVANYVASLAKTQEVVRPENTVVKAGRIDGDVPDTPDDPRWDGAAPVTFFLVPQILAKERLFTPSNDTITVRAVYSDTALAILVEWDDRTKSLPGDLEAEAIAEPNMAEDAVAVQLPVEIPEGMEKPYFGMGDAANPVNVWHWKSGSKKGPESVQRRPRFRRHCKAGSRDAGPPRERPLSSGYLACGHGAAACDRRPGKRHSVCRGALHAHRPRRLGRQQRRGWRPAHHDHLVLAAARARVRRQALFRRPVRDRLDPGRGTLVATRRHAQARQEGGGGCLKTGQDRRADRARALRSSCSVSRLSSWAFSTPCCPGAVGSRSTGPTPY
jgi:mono/diheme cytochrome c family protein